MNESEERPNPDELLKMIRRQETESSAGSLKIFFGMCAGVGKTFAMLEAAKQRQKEGVSVVVAVINTHGRKETEALLEGLSRIPEKWITYKDMVFEEMDLQAILDMKPELVLVDELAHTNVPGSKHTKRWQDVLEILDNGIDVYTTLNVQHLESRKEAVERITGIQVHETVPDLVLERAASIALIDLPVRELLQRLHEGKVYLGDPKIRIAVEHFFKEENLMVFRELALRFTAEKVDHDLHEIRVGKNWETRERLLVAISSSPSSERLIRATRRIAFELDAPWIAVYVDTGKTLSDEDQARLYRHCSLARELGAEVITTHDLDIANALQRLIKQRDITRVIMGRPPKTQLSFLTSWYKKNLFERLENENKYVDIILLRQGATDVLHEDAERRLGRFSSLWKQYGLVFLLGSILTPFGLCVAPLIGYKSVGFIFLFGILAASYFVSRGPIILAAILSTIFWYLLFLPSSFFQEGFFSDDLVLILLYFIVAIVIGTATSRIREQDQFLRKREEIMERLYQIEQEIVKSSDVEYLREHVCARLESYFPGEFEILIQGANEQLRLDSDMPQLRVEKEEAVMLWVYKNGEIGGWSTNTLPSSEGMYFPIKFGQKVVGVLAYVPTRKRPLLAEEINLVQTINQQLGNFLGRYCLKEHVVRQEFLGQTERIHRSVLHSLSRSFYTPLEEVITLNERIGKEVQEPSLVALTKQLQRLTIKIKFTVDNMIAMSELESGVVRFDRKRQSIQELLNTCLEDIDLFRGGHEIVVDIPPQHNFFPFDFTLLRFAVNNLLLNALEYSPQDSQISVVVSSNEQEFTLSISDHGPGIPEDVLPYIFNKFYRKEDVSYGLGLGLAIVKAVVDVHRGRIEVTQNVAVGCVVSLSLPN